MRIVKFLSELILKFLLKELALLQSKLYLMQRKAEKVAQRSTQTYLTLITHAKENKRDLPNRFINYAIEAAVFRYANN